MAIIILTCSGCQKNFTVSWENKNNPRKYCSVACANIHLNKNKAVYGVSKPSARECRHCSETIIINKFNRNNVFCNRACEYAHKNKVKLLPAKKVRLYASEASRQHKKDYMIKWRRERRYECKCLVCGNDLKGASRRTKTCSHECLKVFFFEHGKKAGQNSKKNVVKRSRDEIALYQFCCSLWPDATHNEIIKDGWNADIVVQSYKTAILWNGPWHYKQLNMSNHSLLQVQTRDRIKTELFQKNGWRVFVFEDRHYTPETAFRFLKCELTMPV